MCLLKFTWPGLRPRTICLESDQHKYYLLRNERPVLETAAVETGIDAWLSLVSGFLCRLPPTRLF